jgi:uncharacterized protein (DUF305 family)
MLSLTVRRGVAALIAPLLMFTIWLPSGSLSAAQDEATPVTAYSCEMVSPEPAGSTMEHDHGMVTGTPMPDMMMHVEFDQLYIDMMIPHHASIIAMSHAALPLLADERLREIAQAVVATQEPEIEELRDLRERFYGDPEPLPMDDHLMAMMDEAMPGMGETHAEAAMQMDPDALVATFCAADDYELAFIDLTIAHHAAAITASEAALEEATHEEIRDLAERVIEAQEVEIDLLNEIRAELTGEETPAPTG